MRIKPLEELTEAKLKPDFVGKGGRHHILTDPEAYSETNMELLDRTERAIHIIIKEVDGNAIVVSRGDVNNAMLEDMVERRVSAEKYYVLDTDPAALSILKIKEQPILVLYNFHCKMFAEF